jgi:hypothetical protein
VLAAPLPGAPFIARLLARDEWALFCRRQE